MARDSYFRVTKSELQMDECTATGLGVLLVFSVTHTDIVFRLFIVKSLNLRF